MKKNIMFALVISIVILNKGLAVEIPTPPEIDPSCDQSLVESLQSKQSCFLGLESPTACLAVAAFGGAAAGGYAAHILEKSISKQASPEVQKKFLAAIAELKMEKANTNKAYALQRQSRDKAFEEHSKGAYKTEEQWRASQKSYTKVPADIQQLINKNTEAALKSDISSEVKDSLKRLISNDPSFTTRRVQEKIASIFPEEGKALQKLYARQEAIGAKYMNIENGLSYDQRVEKLSKLMSEANEVNAEIDRLTKTNARFKLVNQLMKLGYQSTLGGYKDFRSKIFLSARQAIDAEGEALKGKSKSSGKAGAGAVAGTALVSGFMIGNLLSGQVNIRTCRDTFGFSDSEIDFLGNDHFFTVAKAMKVGGFKCENLAILDSDHLYEDLSASFGGVPKGICKLIKQQNKNLDKLLGDFATNPSVTCDGMTDTNLKLYKDAEQSPIFLGNAGKDILEYRSGDYTYKAPLDSSEYPDFRFIRAFDQEGKEVKNESLKMQSFYNNLHPAGTLSKRVDLEDLTSPCE